MPPPITGRQVQKAAVSFKTGTGEGVDSLHPRAFLWLSQPLQEAVATFLNVVEATGTWPMTVSSVLLHLIPKPSGGRRPIAPLAAIVRVWERIGKPIIRKWSEDNRHDYDWAGRGEIS